jgi:hydrogenase maturation protease
VSPARRVIVGIGNPDRGDDAVGRVVARRLARDDLSGVSVIEHGGEASSLLSVLEAADTAVLIDACVSGAAPGTVHRIDARKEDLPDMQFGLSTHSFGLASAMTLGRALGMLPAHCAILAIEAGHFEPGEPLSVAVSAAVDDVAEAARNEVMANA